ncbi:S-adenosylmethionine decarboxylase [Ramlibacter rhizophilus]|uniref:S-adenosylmethionine decarboxylase proenzyme n=1 Tax=Ramlibacter rhizophilus TaxID=1781167 RepID=A0A4Z0BJ62_9BURK|nr:S-adenosylmethionine decarboxylase [Ramlibacter rhizophilus]TFY97928.1 S-adenosylmethionine decarboxylase proenzyme [Ramlibacter rhizophilus]
MRALHLTADLYRCRCAAGWLSTAEPLRSALRQVAEAGGFETHGELFCTESDGPVSGVLLMRGARLDLRTAPAARGALLDLQIALDGEDEHSAAQARALMEALVARFAPEWTEQRSLDRGDEA